MSRISYCTKCDSGEKELLHLQNSEEFNGLTDVHFVSRKDPRWESYESTSLFFMGPEHLIDRVMARKKQELGSPPDDLKIHTCE